MEGFEKKDREREEIFSKAVRAGKRTYFFDVKATRKNDYYITITESKKRYDEDGRFHYEKHKIFLYKEDFDKFAEGLDEIISYIRENQPEIENKEENQEDVTEPISTEEYTNVEFEDLTE
ncbi:MAG: PUR family DNA/RNA-binding protein [Chlorobi bacterium]|nr:PUR family DNA/RNA-binding protein [Chlorobiota bacterium]